MNYTYSNVNKFLGICLVIFMAMPAFAYSASIPSAGARALSPKAGVAAQKSSKATSPKTDISKEFRGGNFVTLNELPGDPKVSCELPNLKYKSQRLEVYLLQMALKNGDYYPEGFITGYFGRATRKAVKRFQKAYNLPQTGNTDTATRAALNVFISEEFPECEDGGGDEEQPQETIFISKISPFSGSVGSDVTIYGDGFTKTENTVKFGNGYIKNIASFDGATLKFAAPESLDFCPPGITDCPLGFAKVNPGKYGVSIMNANGTSNSVVFEVIDSGEPPPPVVNQQPKLGEFSIPQGIQPGAVAKFLFTASDPDGDNLSWTINWGDGMGEASACPSSKPNTNYAVSHSWSKAGNYRVSVKVNDCKGGSDSTSFSVNVGEIVKNRPPVISEVGGPTTLKVDETGTWTVKAYDTDGTYLSYSVDWGDNKVPAPIPLSASREAVTQEATLTHSYALAGVYKVIFTVSDKEGAQAQTSITVNVIDKETPPAVPKLNISLAADNPLPATAISDDDALTGAQALIPALKLKFNYLGVEPVTVRTIKITRGGLSSDTDISAAYLYDGEVKLAHGQVISADTFTFQNPSGIFTIPAGGDKVITFKFDLKNFTSAGKTINFRINSAGDIVVNNNALVFGFFPLNGHYFTTTVVTDLGQLVIRDASQFSTPNPVVELGQKNQEIWKLEALAANQDIELRKVVFTLLGSVLTGDLKNFALFDGSTMLGSQVPYMKDGNKILFDLSASPLIIRKGTAKTLSLRADIVSGVERTFRPIIQEGTDVSQVDRTYGVFLKTNWKDEFTPIQPLFQGNPVDFLIRFPK